MGAISATIITIASAGVISAFAEGICQKVGKEDYAQFIRFAGFSVAGVVALNTAIAFFKTLKQF